MHRREANTGLFVALISMTFTRPETVSALIQAKCRPEYRNLPSGVVHTACKGPNPRCSLDRRLTGLSEQVKQQALQVHNHYRSQVAKGQLQYYPSATNMYELEWDDEMAAVAQAFAEQCDYSDHDRPEARTTSRFQSVGQSYGWAIDARRQTDTEGKTWVDDWFAEYVHYNPNAVASFDTGTSRGVVTHFTQVIWAETRYIGCGFSNFQHGNGHARIFVCNYAPAGNRGGKAIYLSGPTCSACPPGTTCNPATGLCRRDGASEPAGAPRPNSQAQPGGLKPEGSAGAVGTVGGPRVGQVGDASDDGDLDVGFTVMAAIAMFIAFLLGVCIGASVVTLCRPKKPSPRGGAAYGDPNATTMGMSTMDSTIG
ncbi:hypothetical protein HPB50_029057 [Hyalomma asiaticum]|nr:hypothetical protein HPB50_029057 [Hyalomma asiaticum]